MKGALFFLAIITFSCGTIKDTQKEKESYFEGVITYSIDYLPLSDNYSRESLKEFIGAKMILTFEQGNFKKEYYSSNGNLLSQRYLNLDDQRSYSKSIGNDTIYWFDITKLDSRTEFIRIRDTTILNHPTIGIGTETFVSGVGFGDKTFRVVGEYYYSKSLRVDPNWYVNYKEGNFNEIIKVGKGIQLLTISEGLFWAQIISAQSIEIKDIEKSDITLEIKEDALLKEL